MKKYNISGMSCAACSARIEKAVAAVEGVDSCAVNLLTNSMNVEGTASESAVIAAVAAAGYGAECADSRKKSDSAQQAEIITNNGASSIKRRLLLSAGFLAALMYASMGHMMWGWQLPEALAENYLAQGLLQLLLAATVMLINQKFFISGFKALVKGAPNMDTLVAMGSGAAFGYSVYALFAMTAAHNNPEAVHSYMHEFYFESAAMILTLITVGKLLEARAKGKTADALKGLMELAPKTATVILDGKEAVIPIEELKVGDIFAVKPGESIPADGIVLEGNTAVDESALTGESVPVDKSEGDRVTGATINRMGYIKCKVLRVAEDTTLAQIIKLVGDTAASKAPVAKAADKVSGVFVPVVIAISLVTIAVWLILGETVGFAVARGISVLVISCPCALGLATPVAIMVGSGVGAKNGILFKTAAALEETGKVKIVALDKTGTITKGKPRVTDIIPFGGIDKKAFLQLAAAVEKKSEHPLAEAIVTKAADEGLALQNVSDFKAFAGNGITARIDEDIFFAGNLSYISQKAEAAQEIKNIAVELSNQGKTPMYFAKNNELIGIIAVADTIKEDSRAGISELKALGIRTVMITGDNENTAKNIAQEAGIDEVVAGVLPDGKSDVVKKLMKNSKVAMVGDGINDAPSLVAADVGIAIGAGSDIAIDAADVVLMKNSICDVAAAIKVSKATLRNIHENLFWAFVYNVIGIPLAAGVFISAWGWQLNPMFGAAAMSLSSFCVVSNALRLNFVKLHNKKTQPKAEKIEEDKKIMTKTIEIEGMMCPHCEANVKAALEAVSGVAAAEVSHKKGTAVVRLDAEVSDAVLKATVESKGYKVLSV